jgi:hypothetical protein
MVLHQLAPGTRVRLRFAAEHRLRSEASEHNARGLWELICPPEWAAKLQTAGATL